MKFQLVLFVLVFLCGCKSESIEQSSKGNYTLNLKTTVRYSIDSQTSPYYLRHQYLPEEEKLIISNTNKNDKSLIELDLVSQKLRRLANTKVEGGDNTLGNGHFYYHNKDTIFFLGPYNQTLYFTTDSGEIYDQIKFRDANPDLELGQVHLLMGTNSGIFDNKELTFVVFPRNLNSRNMKMAVNDPLFGRINIASRKLSALPLKYELDYVQPVRYPGHLTPIVTSSAEKGIVFTFPTSDKVYWYKNGKLESKEFKSDYFEKYIHMNDYERIMNFHIEAFQNKKLLYNPKQKRYFMFISLGVPLVDPDSGSLNDMHSKPFVILVLDESLDKISEHRFEASTYNLGCSFISNDALYLSLNNPNNDNFDEDAFQYEVYEYAKISD